MDQAIIDVVLGLVLIYITLALLAMKVQEGLQGGVFKRRTSNLHDLLFEAVGRDSTLKQQILNNPLISGLFKDTKAEKGMRSSGPGAIPPPLFARALLMALNDGEHPSVKFATPQAFIDSRASAPNNPPSLGSVKALMPGRESDWASLEAALAQWFNDVGDRSEGWYKRESTRWSFGVALGLALLLNVDSYHVASTLSVDPEARRGLGDLAQRVQALREQEAAGAAGQRNAAANAPTAPSVEQQVSEALDSAIKSLGKAYFKDKAGAFSGFRTQPAHVKVECASFGMLLKPGIGAAAEFQSAELWVRLLPAIQAHVNNAANERSDVARESRESARRCLNSLTGWISIARGLAADEATERLIDDTSKSLAVASLGLRILGERAKSSVIYSHLFAADPEAFHACHRAEPSRVAFEDCMARTLRDSVRLPIGWLPSNTRRQFCTVIELDDRAPAPAEACSLGEAKAFDVQNNALGVGRLFLVPKTGWLHWAAWFVGILVTTLFVSLGAPFWFDVLGRVTKLRVTGAVREDGAAQPKPPAGTPPKPDAKPGAGFDQPPPFSDVRNRFEDALTAADVVRLQQALDIAATSRLDGPTRRRIAAFCADNGLPVAEELDLLLYERIVGRSPTGSPLRREPALQTGAKDPRADALAKALAQQLDFATRAQGTTMTWTADARALAVLYRYKTDPEPQATRRRVFDLARTDPQELERLPDALAASILGTPGVAPATRARESAPWLDWAIGELGQVEKGGKNRATSNPRICEYLDAAVAQQGNAGDDTAWCGAYVAWVIERFNEECAKRSNTGAFVPLPSIPQLEPNGTSALTASRWTGWGTPRGATPGAALAAAMPGDVIVVATNAARTTFHVGFVFDLVMTNGSPSAVHVLGGNQADGSRVCLSRFDAAAVEAVCR